MEFWGIEVKPGKPFDVEIEDGYLLHVSQISLGETKKVGDETVQVYVRVIDRDLNAQKLVLANLSGKIPQVSLDAIFDVDFEISHECKNSSVYILGYKAPAVGPEFDSEDEEIPMERFQSELKKSEANDGTDQKANLEADESESEDEDEDDSDEMGSDDDDEDSEEEEEETPVKVEPPTKKNKPNGGAMNNNASKKAKAAVSQKPSGGHKGHKCGGVHPPKRN